jgi:hypothetical protein
LPGATPYERAVAAQRTPGQERYDGSLDLREIVRLATLAASSHNTQPWTFRLGERTVTIDPDFSRRCPVVDPDDGHLFKSLGCAAENAVHAAAAQGHAAHVVFDPSSSSMRVYMEPSRTVRASALFHAIVGRQSTKLAYDGRIIDKAGRAALEAAGAVAGVRTLLIEEAATRDAIIDYVRAGDMAQLSDPAFRSELMSWMRFNDSSAIRTGDGLALRTIGQPAAPDWIARLIVRFVLTGRAQARTDETNIRSSPLIAVFAAENDTPQAWVETGRAYERFALQATTLGIRTAFINQPIEVRSLRPQLNTLLGLQDETALLMLRIGYGPLAPFSLRRPIDAVIATAQ